MKNMNISTISMLVDTIVVLNFDTVKHYTSFRNSRIHAELKYKVLLSKCCQKCGNILSIVTEILFVFCLSLQPRVCCQYCDAGNIGGHLSIILCRSSHKNCLLLIGRLKTGKLHCLNIAASIRRLQHQSSSLILPIYGEKLGLFYL